MSILRPFDVFLTTEKFVLGIFVGLHGCRGREAGGTYQEPVLTGGWYRPVFSEPAVIGGTGIPIIHFTSANS